MVEDDSINMMDLIKQPEFQEKVHQARKSYRMSAQLGIASKLTEGMTYEYMAAEPEESKMELSEFDLLSSEVTEVEEHNRVTSEF